MTAATAHSNENDEKVGLRFYSKRPGFGLADLSELWQFRDLIWMFALRDLKVRYRQTLIGIAWAVVQPVMTMVVFGILFTLIKGKPHSSEVAYPVTSMCGLVPWQLFASTVVAATLSVSSNAQLVQRVYFPRIALPIASIIPAIVDFLIAFVVLLGMMLAFGAIPTWRVVFLPVMVFGIVMVSLSLSLWLSALNAIYRDVQYAVPFLIQIGMLASPAVYEMRAVIPEKWQLLYACNPMVGVLEGFRWSLLGTPAPDWKPIVISSLVAFILLAGGLIYFRRMERYFADRI